MQLTFLSSARVAATCTVKFGFRFKLIRKGYPSSERAATHTHEICANPDERRTTKITLANNVCIFCAESNFRAVSVSFSFHSMRVITFIKYYEWNEWSHLNNDAVYNRMNAGNDDNGAIEREKSEANQVAAGQQLVASIGAQERILNFDYFVKTCLETNGDRRKRKKCWICRFASSGRFW